MYAVEEVVVEVGVKIANNGGKLSKVERPFKWSFLCHLCRYLRWKCISFAFGDDGTHSNASRQHTVFRCHENKTRTATVEKQIDQRQPRREAWCNSHPSSITSASVVETLNTHTIIHSTWYHGNDSGYTMTANVHSSNARHQNDAYFFWMMLTKLPNRNQIGHVVKTLDRTVGLVNVMLCSQQWALWLDGNVKCTTISAMACVLYWNLGTGRRWEILWTSIELKFWLYWDMNVGLILVFFFSSADDSQLLTRTHTSLLQHFKSI